MFRVQSLVPRGGGGCLKTDIGGPKIYSDKLRKVTVTTVGKLGIMSITHRYACTVVCLVMDRDGVFGCTCTRCICITPYSITLTIQQEQVSTIANFASNTGALFGYYHPHALIVWTGACLPNWEASLSSIQQPSYSRLQSILCRASGELYTDQ